MKTYDTIIVGGGTNTLTAAAYLAKAGHSILVLEKNPYVGGGAVTQEITIPGFLHELHAIGILWAKSNPLLANDELGLYSKHGLETIEVEGAGFSSLFDDGNSLCSYYEIDKTCDEIARFSAKDADAYKAFMEKGLSLFGLIKRGMFTPPMALGSLMNLLSSSENGRYLNRLMFSSAYDVINRIFENGYVRSHFYKWVAELNCSPDEAGTGIFMLLLLGMGHVENLAVFKGGNQQIAEALCKAINACGGEVRKRTTVGKINIRSGKITGVTLGDGEVINASKTVITATPPWDLHKFIDNLDTRLLGDVNDIKPSGHGTFVTHYALKKAPVYRNASSELSKSFGVECMINDIDKFRRCYDDFKFGEMPKLFSGHSFCPSVIDPSRAPNGQHTLYFYHYVPLIPKGRTLGDWSEIKDDFADWMLEEFQRYTVNMDSSNILRRCVESPYDMALHSPSFRYGDVYGCGMTVRQFMRERPTAELGNYRVPGIDGLYLCGPSQHPGGGVIGGGRPVAMRVMLDQKMDLRTAFVAL